jgi:hypothetical protein
VRVGVETQILQLIGQFMQLIATIGTILTEHVFK